MWDVHTRIGGTAGTQLQSDTCSKNPTVTAAANTNCEGAFLLLHVTAQATIYLENSWFWVADHELDLGDHNQINIFNGRGVLIASEEGPVWMYGTSSEHSVLYNYQIANASSVYMGLIQTETPYFQSNPDASTPFTANAAYSDPVFSGDASINKAWGLRIVDSEDVFVYGAGLYSFFDNYGQTWWVNFFIPLPLRCGLKKLWQRASSIITLPPNLCKEYAANLLNSLTTESCQDNMVSLENSGSVYLYGLSTKAATNMVTVDGQSAALDSDNRNNFCATIAMFAEAGASSNTVSKC
jgi:hypothetical protein